MRKNFYPRRWLFMLGLALLLSSATHRLEAEACPVTPSSPGELEGELQRAILNQPVCIQKWTKYSDPAFASWSNGGSLNLPVVTAAIGLYRNPTANVVRGMAIPVTSYKITYVNWWIWFLAKQIGQTNAQAQSFIPPGQGFTPPPDRNNLPYFKGNELFSNIYEASVVTSVIAVRSWAYNHQNVAGAASIITLSEKYLKATWLLYSLAAGSGPVWTYSLPGRTPVYAPTPPARDTQYRADAPRNLVQGSYIYGGHFLALAGGRSPIALAPTSNINSKWNYDDKFPLFDRAIEWTRQYPGAYENSAQRGVLNSLPAWTAPATGPQQGENLYGLTSTDRNQLRTIAQQDDTSNIQSLVTSWLAGFRMVMTYRIVGWQGWRASCMETNLDGNTPNMFAVVYNAPAPNDPKQSVATFLFPWKDGHGNGGGLGELENGQIKADNGLTGSEQKTVTAQIPTTTPLFHVVLSKGADAYLDFHAPSSWPPPPPPDPKAGTYTLPYASPPATGFGGDVSLLFDRVPAGAIVDGNNEGWNWILTNPNPTSETDWTHQSNLVSGMMHQHYFFWSTESLSLKAADSLYTYVYLDPMNPPSEVMLQWFEPSTGWEHRAFWGADQLPYGTSGQISRYPMGNLPPTGQWWRLEVPAGDVGLEGISINGMAFTLFGGQATWSEAGKNVYGMDTVWVEDGIPTGGVPASANGDTWYWVNNPSPVSGDVGHQSNLYSIMHQHYFTWATDTLTPNPGDKLIAYVYLDPANPPSEVMLQWFEGVGGWEHRAFWGADQLAWGVRGQNSRYYMGPLPPAGRWIRLEVPANSVGLENIAINGMAFTLYGGRATWDHAGKTP
jgi:hypothetical protein